MLYRAIRAVNEHFALGVFGFFVLLFFVALAFTFIYPIVPLVLVFFSLFLVVFFWLIFKAMGGMARSMARRWMRSGQCPACDGKLIAMEAHGERLQECDNCRRAFMTNGDEWDEDEMGQLHPESVPQTN
jgi:hypothetical protein